MAEPLAAAVHAVARGSDAGDVGILGGGPMGLMLTALLVAEGRSVTLADPHPERRDQATELGARSRRPSSASTSLCSRPSAAPRRGAPPPPRPPRVASSSSSADAQRHRGKPRDRPAPLRGARAARDVPPRARRGRPRAGRARRGRPAVANAPRPTIPLERLPPALATPTGGRLRSGWWIRGLSPPELQVLDDPARVADRLAVDHEHRHPPLIRSAPRPRAGASAVAAP